MRFRTKFLRYLCILLFLILIPFGTSGCGTNFESLALELLEEWADIHNVNPTSVGGAVNLAKRSASETTGNEEADAALGIVKTIQDVREGDAFMEEGDKLRSQGNLDGAAEKMDAAIEKRPNDWSYRVSRIALGFEQNDNESYIEHENKARNNNNIPLMMFSTPSQTREKNKHENPAQEDRYFTCLIDELESGRLIVGDMHLRTKLDYYRQLEYAYTGRYEAKRVREYPPEALQHDFEMAKHYYELTIETYREING